MILEVPLHKDQSSCKIFGRLLVTFSVALEVCEYNDMTGHLVVCRNVCYLSPCEDLQHLVE